MMGARREPLWRRYLRFFGPDVAADVDAEVGFHLEMREQDYLARGMSPDDAQAAVRARFGDAERFRRSRCRRSRCG